MIAGCRFAFQSQYELAESLASVSQLANLTVASRLPPLTSNNGPQRLELACRRANAFGMTGLRRLKAILKSHLDEVPMVADEPESPAIDHDNLRGQQYYS